MELTEYEKIAHLLRRLGLGAGRREVDKYLSLGVEGTLDRLINFEKSPQAYPVSIWEWHVRPNGDVLPSAEGARAWWVMGMACTERPLQERLSLFWHDHFAISEAKVGPYEIHDYTVKLRATAGDRFEKILNTLALSPAMLRWLDGIGGHPLRPNENLARELMELFTIGIGNYSEEDVATLASCLSGFGLQFAFPGGEGTQNYLREAIRQDLPLVVATAPVSTMGRGEQLFRGVKSKLEPNGVLKKLSGERETAERLVRKAWVFFVEDDVPPKSEVDRLVNVLLKSDMDLRRLIAAIARRPYFWEERVVRQLPKSPVDFSIALARQLMIGSRYLNRRPASASPLDSIRPAAGSPFLILGLEMHNQGLSLLRAPDVDGWKWGKGWLTAAAALARQRLARQLFASGWADDYLSEAISGYRKLDAASAVNAIASDLDIPLNDGSRALLIKSLENLGGPDAALADILSARKSMAQIGTRVAMIPEFSLY